MKPAGGIKDFDEAKTRAPSEPPPEPGFNLGERPNERDPVEFGPYSQEERPVEPYVGNDGEEEETGPDIRAIPRGELTPHAIPQRLPDGSSYYTYVAPEGTPESFARAHHLGTDVGEEGDSLIARARDLDTRRDLATQAHERARQDEEGERLAGLAAKDANTTAHPDAEGPDAEGPDAQGAADLPSPAKELERAAAPAEPEQNNAPTHTPRAHAGSGADRHTEPHSVHGHDNVDATQVLTGAQTAGQDAPHGQPDGRHPHAAQTLKTQAEPEAGAQAPVVPERGPEQGPARADAQAGRESAVPAAATERQAARAPSREEAEKTLSDTHGQAAQEDQPRLLRAIPKTALPPHVTAHTDEQGGVNYVFVVPAELRARGWPDTVPLGAADVAGNAILIDRAWMVYAQHLEAMSELSAAWSEAAEGPDSPDASSELANYEAAGESGGAAVAPVAQEPDQSTSAPHDQLSIRDLVESYQESQNFRALAANEQAAVNAAVRTIIIWVDENNDPRATPHNIAYLLRQQPDQAVRIWMEEALFHIGAGNDMPLPSTVDQLREHITTENARGAFSEEDPLDGVNIVVMPVPSAHPSTSPSM